MPVTVGGLDQSHVYLGFPPLVLATEVVVSRDLRVSLLDHGKMTVSVSVSEEPGALVEVPETLDYLVLPGVFLRGNSVFAATEGF